MKKICCFLKKEGLLLSNEKILSKMGNKMNEGMLMPYEKLFTKIEKEENKK